MARFRRPNCASCISVSCWQINPARTPGRPAGPRIQSSGCKFSMLTSAKDRPLLRNACLKLLGCEISWQSTHNIKRPPLKLFQRWSLMSGSAVGAESGLLDATLGLAAGNEGFQLVVDRRIQGRRVEFGQRLLPQCVGAGRRVLRAGEAPGFVIAPI